MMKTMKRLAAFVVVVAAVAAPTFATPGWMTDMSVAMKRAQIEKKDLLLNFTGSDWCGPCIILKQQVFNHEAFTRAALEDFVLVELDFPHNKAQSPGHAAHNQHWANKLGVFTYPTIVLADDTGTPYAVTGFRPGGPDAYVEHLQELRQRRIDRDEMFHLAQTGTTAERASYLDAAMEAVGLDLAAKYYAETVEQIVELDADNEAGFKEKYAPILKMQQIDAEMEAVIGLLESNQADEAVEKVNQIIATYAPEGQTLTQMRFMQSQVRMMQGRTTEAIVFIDQAIAAAPQPQIAAQLEQIKGRMLAAMRPSYE